MRPLRPRSRIRPTLPGFALCGFSSSAHIIGVSVSEITADSVIEMASTTANSLNRRPTAPPMNSSGMNTASSESVMLMIVKPICFAPSIAASRGDFPCSR
jgi:hypothetical protein